MTKGPANMENEFHQQNLYIYMVAWSIHRIYEVVGAGNQTLGWHFASQLSIVSITLAAIAFKSVRLWMISMLAVVLADFSLMPFIWDSEYWCLLTDFSVLYISFSTLGFQRVLFNPDSFSKEETGLLYNKLQSTIILQMHLFYFAAFFWKLNWDFLDANSSCAPIFVMQLLDHILPEGAAVPELVLKVLVQTSPIMVLMLEGFIAVAFAQPKTTSSGVLAAMVLHLGIAMCPPPSNVATFSLMCASRLVLFVPYGAAQAVRRSAWSSTEVAGIVLATATAAKIANHEDFYDMAYPLFILCGPFVIKAALLEESGKTDGARPTTNASATGSATAASLPVTVAFGYAFLCIIFGTMDQGQPHMYANLRLHGGSNHILGLPTALLHKWYEHDQSSVFFGGVVRIESSTLASLNEIYPGDYTDQMSERSRKFMVAGGHTSRNFNPMLTAVTSSEAPWDSRTSEFIKYTMPVHELRRILQVARENNESFVIEYTQLEGLGDEEWRSTAPGRRIRLEQHSKSSRCRVLGGGRCSETDVGNLPPLPYWARKLLLFEPYPILPGNHRLHCFGP